MQVRRQGRPRAAKWKRSARLPSLEIRGGKKEELGLAHNWRPEETKRRELGREVKTWCVNSLVAEGRTERWWPLLLLPLLCARVGVAQMEIEIEKLILWFDLNRDARRARLTDAGPRLPMPLPPPPLHEILLPSMSHALCLPSWPGGGRDQRTKSRYLTAEIRTNQQRGPLVHT